MRYKANSIIVFLVVIIGVLVGTAVYLSSEITTFEECENAGWLIRSIKVYDDNGSTKKECFLWAGKSFVKQIISVDQSTPQTNTQQQWETKTDDQNSVTVAVTPLDISPQSSEWKFDISMNTHSVELDQDLTKSAVLIDDQGNEYKPIKWDGPVGGHHREGTLIFKPITPASKSIELKITGIANVARIFLWQLNLNN